MAEIKEWEIRKWLMDLSNKYNLRLWTMIFSLIQQTLQLDVGLYIITII